MFVLLQLEYPSFHCLSTLIMNIVVLRLGSRTFGDSKCDMFLNKSNNNYLYFASIFHGNNGYATTKVNG